MTGAEHILNDFMHQLAALRLEALAGTSYALAFAQPWLECREGFAQRVAGRGDQQILRAGHRALEIRKRSELYRERAVRQVLRVDARFLHGPELARIAPPQQRGRTTTRQMNRECGAEGAGTEHRDRGFR